MAINPWSSNFDSSTSPSSAMRALEATKAIYRLNADNSSDAEISMDRTCSIKLPKLLQHSSFSQLSPLSKPTHSSIINDNALKSSTAARRWRRLSPPPYSSPSPCENKDPNTESPHIPRPPNSFILFRQEYCKHYNRKGKRLTQNISQSASAIWKSLPSEDKKYWKQRADEEKAKHQEMYPGYKFRPQNSSNKEGDERRRKEHVTLASLSEAETQKILSLDAEASPDAGTGDVRRQWSSDSRRIPSPASKLSTLSVPNSLGLFSGTTKLSPLYDAGLECYLVQYSQYTSSSSSSDVSYPWLAIRQPHPVAVHRDNLSSDFAFDMSVYTSMSNNLLLVDSRASELITLDIPTHIPIDDTASPFPSACSASSSAFQISGTILPTAHYPRSSKILHSIQTPVLLSHDSLPSSPWNAHAKSFNSRALSEPPPVSAFMDFASSSFRTSSVSNASRNANFSSTCMDHSTGKLRTGTLSSKAGADIGETSTSTIILQRNNFKLERGKNCGEGQAMGKR